MGFLGRIHDARNRAKAKHIKKIQLRKEEKEADKYSTEVAKSDARQMKRMSKAEYIKKKEGTYIPLGERLKELKKIGINRSVGKPIKGSQSSALELGSSEPNPAFDLGSSNKKKKGPFDL